ncbi:Na+/H+ antiporter NhaC family protein [Kangiella aquimarina]|uniref:Na+/H+ antiporter NhaC family protein n=1 Tax=Kangiella aquimarina TaxID=261965 RepID=A0ABZ0X6V5_9GAMM|nr:Na+/H+ antiporter NhaC family protein [Kangiella aquimarina]WQG86099.1 Na+/H+ antiporter NhaC family protein [Kangiella aquimarina]
MSKKLATSPGLSSVGTSESITETRHSKVSSHNPAHWLALLPLVLFLVLFLGSGIYYTTLGVEYAFYQLPAPVAVLPAIAVALFLAKGTFESRIAILLKGIGDSNIVAMCLIYLLAGAFAALTGVIGAIDAVVNFGLYWIPPGFILPGLFVIAAVVSFAMGTSMGTLAALAPIGFGLSQTAGLEPAIVAGILLSGAMFGDNLSVISDTSIAATRTQGATVGEKLRQNARWAIPAAIITISSFSLIPTEPSQAEVADYQLYKVIPYLAIVILALTGLSVFIILPAGIIVSIGIGLISGSFTVDNSVAQTIYQGFSNMQEIFLLSLLIGGLGALIEKQGGLQWLVNKISQLFAASQSKLRAQLAVLSTAAVTNLAVANNTVSIILTGKVTQSLANQGNIEPMRSASLVDIGACSTQGILPYGAQCLLLGASFGISPLEPVQYVWYLPILLAVVFSSLLFRKGA